MPIHVLPPSVAAQIAAGEVVERPASVVKELIENSLDADARAISVEVRDGGLSLIRVSDDGSGIPRADVPLTLRRFATSKIRTAEDLQRVRTLGFRGEALASIAAVSRLELLTRTQDELEGTRLRADGETVSTPEIEPAASPVGASVTVRDLFYNTPARRRFLKSPRRELELIQRTVLRYALAYPRVAFRLVADGRERLVLPPASPLERIGLALGREVAAEMVEVRWEAMDLRVHGYVGKPAIARSNREGQFFYVNGRPVRAGLLAVMLERPYAGLLPPGRRPLAVVHIEVEPWLVDVNVHPRKAEVRFAQERPIYGAVQRAVEDALADYPRPVGEAMPGFAWPFADLAAPGEAVREAGVEYVAARPRALAQVHYTYILAQTPDGLLIVDQHAAHEQILYERLSQGEETVPLTPPAQVTLTAREMDLLGGYLPLLRELGLEIEPFGGNTLLVRALPRPLAAQDPQEVLTVLLEELRRYRRSGEADLRERLTMRLACLAAVKAGDPLDMAQMQKLLDDLEAAWSPSTCPHGRPAFIAIGLEELERRFQRR